MSPSKGISSTSRSHQHLFNLIEPFKVLELHHKWFMIVISFEIVKSVDCWEEISRLTWGTVDCLKLPVDWLRWDKPVELASVNCGEKASFQSTDPISSRLTKGKLIDPVDWHSTNSSALPSRLVEATDQEQFHTVDWNKTFSRLLGHQLTVLEGPVDCVATVHLLHQFTVDLATRLGWTYSTSVDCHYSCQSTD